jgi:hypothetical protein
MSETVTPWKFSVEGESGLERYRRRRPLPAALARRKRTWSKLRVARPARLDRPQNVSPACSASRREYHALVTAILSTPPQ